MPCILLFRIVIIVLVYCRAPSPTQHASDTSFVPPPSPSITNVSRDANSCRHSMPRFTSTVYAPYHTPVCTLCPATPRNLLLLFSVPNAIDDEFDEPLAIPSTYSSSFPRVMWRLTQAQRVPRRSHLLTSVTVKPWFHAC